MRASGTLPLIFPLEFIFLFAWIRLILNFGPEYNFRINFVYELEIKIEHFLSMINFSQNAFSRS